MLEGAILYILCKRLGNIVLQKGHRQGWYQFLLVVFWFSGEIMGAIAGGALSAITHPGLEEEPLGMIYLMALLGAALGAVSAFAIAWALRPVGPAAAGHGDEEYGRTWREREGDRWPGKPSEHGEPHITDLSAPRPPCPDDRIRE
jgi:hypothetical protein